ncbi:hypothetical protein RB213_010283 [Colletotrichum asianum]
MPAGYPSQVQVDAEISVPSTAATSGDRPLMGYSNNFDIDWVLSLKGDRTKSSSGYRIAGSHIHYPSTRELKSMQWYATERIMGSIGGIQAEITETDHR